MCCKIVYMMLSYVYYIGNSHCSSNTGDCTHVCGEPFVLLLYTVCVPHCFVNLSNQ